MRRKKLLDVILKLDFRMDLGPVVRCPNERQEKQQVLKSSGAEQSFQCIKAFWGVRCLQEYVAGKRKKAVFHRRVSRRHFGKRRGTLQAKRKTRLQLRPARKRPPQQF